MAPDFDHTLLVGAHPPKSAAKDSATMEGSMWRTIPSQRHGAPTARPGFCRHHRTMCEPRPQHVWRGVEAWHSVSPAAQRRRPSSFLNPPTRSSALTKRHTGPPKPRPESCNGKRLVSVPCPATFLDKRFRFVDCDSVPNPPIDSPFSTQNRRPDEGHGNVWFQSETEILLNRSIRARDQKAATFDADKRPRIVPWRRGLDPGPCQSLRRGRPGAREKASGQERASPSTILSPAIYASSSA